ncbi:MAG: hypothetical protein ABFC54_10190, partial [Thermoguttaceae bacterium]
GQQRSQRQSHEITSYWILVSPWVDFRTKNLKIDSNKAKDMGSRAMPMGRSTPALVGSSTDSH